MRCRRAARLGDAVPSRVLEQDLHSPGERGVEAGGHRTLGWLPVLLLESGRVAHPNVHREGVWLSIIAKWTVTLEFVRKEVEPADEILASEAFLFCQLLALVLR